MVNEIDFKVIHTNIAVIIRSWASMLTSFCCCCWSLLPSFALTRTSYNKKETKVRKKFYSFFLFFTLPLQHLPRWRARQYEQHKCNLHKSKNQNVQCFLMGDTVYAIYIPLEYLVWSVFFFIQFFSVCYIARQSTQEAMLYILYIWKGYSRKQRERADTKTLNIAYTIIFNRSLIV